MGPPQHMETDKGRRGTAWNQTQEKERLLLVTDMCTWITAPLALC